MTKTSIFQYLDDKKDNLKHRTRIGYKPDLNSVFNINLVIMMCW
jgi:hypothetical protein